MVIYIKKKEEGEIARRAIGKATGKAQGLLWDYDLEYIEFLLSREEAHLKN